MIDHKINILLSIDFALRIVNTLIGREIMVIIK